MSIDPQTIETYDNSADQIAEHFKKYKNGSMVEEIQKSFLLAGEPANKVVEIGCGAGKGAEEIIKYTKNYQGFDPSSKLIDIAKSQVPEASFTQSDALSYDYPSGVDIIFAFGVFIHLNKKDFSDTMQKVANSLRPGGIFCVTFKESYEYKEHLQEDKFGTRLFYLYPISLIKNLVGVEKTFDLAYEFHLPGGDENKKWVSFIFKKR